MASINRIIAVVALVLVLALLPTFSSAAVDHVVLIAVDGLRIDVVKDRMDKDNLKNFKYFFKRGVCTDNARIDYDISQTTPGFLGMFTGMTVYLNNGKCSEGNKKCHGLDEDGNPCEDANKKCDNLKYPQDISKHKNIFQEADKRKKRFCLFAAKDKFEYFDKQWGLSKDGTYEFNKDGKKTTNKFKKKMDSNKPCEFATVHYREPDKAGHDAKSKNLEKNKKYRQAIKDVDKWIGQIVDKMDAIDDKKNTTTSFILTSDHGFAEENHSDETLPLNYIVPFCVMGDSVSKADRGKDLYELQDPQEYKDPRNKRPRNWSKPEPIRIQDAGPTAAVLLGLPNFSKRDTIRVSSIPKLEPELEPELSETREEL